MNKYGITVDAIIGVGLVIALLVAIFNNGSVELETNIASGLIGYLGKTAITQHTGGESK